MGSSTRPLNANKAVNSLHSPSTWKSASWFACHTVCFSKRRCMIGRKERTGPSIYILDSCAYFWLARHLRPLLSFARMSPNSSRGPRQSPVKEQKNPVFFFLSSILHHIRCRMKRYFDTEKEIEETFSFARPPWELSYRQNVGIRHDQTPLIWEQRTESIGFVTIMQLNEIRSL